ncbi:zinc ribbon domain-containing protein [Aliiruegeria lutimaris]|uniref:Voltage-gated potassium channel n=1 Tax=Aliiruegeria lutimaris TaxID=571298 RepID=A0A1G8V4B4_9RHOB|nr:voltage-gated potassium channel [Aliiruegeria lutimaris]
MMEKLKQRVENLYTGTSPASVRLRYGLILFDLATVIYFIVVTPLPHTALTHLINEVLALFIFVDFLCRFWIAPGKWAHLGRIYVIADILVLGSLVLNRFTGIDLSFLRILRGVRLGYSNYLLQDLRRDSRLFREHEDAIVAALNLVIFVFVTTSAVHVFVVQSGGGPKDFEGYVNALYYTVTTLTTTGYGDFTPTSVGGKLFAVGIMVIGVSLFLRLASVIFTPNKVHYPCPSCGLTRHDPDAVHCKHCGGRLKIETRGAG